MRAPPSPAGAARCRLVLLGAAAVAAVAAGIAAGVPAAAQSFDVPEGFASEIIRQGGIGNGPLSVLRVRPRGGGFARLSHVDLVPLPTAPDDRDAWLKARVTASPETLLPDPRTMLDGADSPFADPAFDGLRAELGRWVDGVAALGDVPLEFCDPPAAGANAEGAFRQMRCAFPLGPFRRHLVLRLQEVEGVWYYTRIATMNAGRLPDLLAIADSFRADAPRARLLTPDDEDLP